MADPSVHTVVQALADTLHNDGLRRAQAEENLKFWERYPSYPGLLITVGSSAELQTSTRQSALSVLRKLIVRNWSDEDDGDEDDGAAPTPRYPIDDANKQLIRNSLMQLLTNEEDNRLVKTAVSIAVTKIAVVDFPDRWPSLLQDILTVVSSNGTDAQLHGALRVLDDLIDECLSVEQFVSMAKSIVETLYQVALNINRRPMLRALAVSVLKNCFDQLSVVREDDADDGNNPGSEKPVVSDEVKNFVREALQGWFPFFLDVLKLPLPERTPGSAAQPEGFKGVVSLKLMAVKTLLKIKSVFKSLLLPESTALFEATWADLSRLQGAYTAEYMEEEGQSRLEDADGIPYSLDFLVLEELDFLRECVTAPPVRQMLKLQLDAHDQVYDTPWVREFMIMLVAYSRITQEQGEMWDMDVSLFLSEETAVTSNYTARTACGDLLIKISEWGEGKFLEGLFKHTEILFGQGNTNWRDLEASLYLFNMLLSDWNQSDKGYNGPDNIFETYFNLIKGAIGEGNNPPNDPLLQARGFLAAAELQWRYPPTGVLFTGTCEAISKSDSDVVRVACIKAAQQYINVPGRVNDGWQPLLLGGIQDFLSSRDFSTEVDDDDDLLATLAEATSQAIRVSGNFVVMYEEPKSIDLLFTIAKYGARNMMVTEQVRECFEDLSSEFGEGPNAPEQFVRFCGKVVPLLTGCFTFSGMTENDPLLTLTTELVAALFQHAPEPLPAGLVAQFAPKLQQLLMNADQAEVLRPSAQALTYMLVHDHPQVFEWHDERGNNGLVVCLQIIDRLLGPGIEDHSASDVGGLAAELVEKAGHQRLGDVMLRNLLVTVATRLSTAQAATLIQSLILVFARLCLNAAGDVVDFLSQTTVATPNGPENGLKLVLSKWLEHSVVFSGYDETRQNVIALSKIYDLNNPSVAHIQVLGDLIVPKSDKIITRSQAKKNPDQYTVIPATLKLLKVLILELPSESDVDNLQSYLGGADAVEDDGDEGWEDADTLDLGLGTTAAALMNFANEGSPRRMADNETQAYVTDFFLRIAREDSAGFTHWYPQLTEKERTTLNTLAV